MAKVGLSARTHHQEGSTPRTLAGSVLELDTDLMSQPAGLGVHN